MSMGNYQSFSQQALKALGGIENLTYVTHCITRLRVSYRSEESVDHEALKNLPDCAGVVQKDHAVQLIIGPKIEDCYREFIEISGWDPNKDDRVEQGGGADAAMPSANGRLAAFSNFVAPVFMDIVPALSVGGMILAIKTLLVNYVGLSDESGTAQMLLSIFSAAFNYIPIYLGWSLSKRLGMPPVLGMLLGGVMVCERFRGGSVSDFLGIPVPQVDYTSSIVPVILGVIFMFFVYRLVKKIMPQTITFFATPMITMLVVVPVTLIVLGPIGTELSDAVGVAIVWMTDTLGFLSQPILCVAYPYMVMLGIDKATTPLQMQLIATLGFDSVTGGVGFVSNLCIGASALALATAQKDKGRRGLFASFGITGLCGITEPAFYGSLIMRPHALVGTAIGAACAGLFSGIFGLRTFVPTSCSGLLTFLNYVDTQTGSLYYVVIAAITAAIAIIVSFIAVRVITAYDARKLADIAAKADAEALAGGAESSMKEA